MNGSQDPQEKPPRRPAAISSEDLEDMDLIAKAGKGDMGAYALLFKRHSDRIRRMAYLILHNAAAADDVVQDTFTRGLAHLQSYRGDAEPRAWLSSIALNLCRHILRDRKNEAELAGTDKLEHGVRVRRPRSGGVLTRAMRKEENHLLTVALGYLTDAQREVFVLHYVDGLQYEELAGILGIRAGAGRALAHRAKEILQKRLGGVGIDNLLKK
jgi:RNA polymerase sigma-70 factor (ECF subfamily)